MADRPDPATDRLMVAFYAAVTAVQDGNVAEVELEHRHSDESTEDVLAITVRRTVRHFHPTPEPDE